MSTADLAPLVVPGGELYGLAGDRYVCFGGGIPLSEPGEDHRVVGAVGVSGGTVAQDVACAEVATALWEGA
jgi:uncharacterized protein GlcG (DUF336 family)